MVADHARGVTFLAADGVVPGNEGRGYVMRRIVRRAVRYGRMLGIERPFLEAIVDRVIDRMREHYPELAANGGTASSRRIVLEEARFAETLAAGTERLNEWIAAGAGARRRPGRRPPAVPAPRHVRVSVRAVRGDPG